MLPRDLSASLEKLGTEILSEGALNRTLYHALSRHCHAEASSQILHNRICLASLTYKYIVCQDSCKRQKWARCLFVSWQLLRLFESTNGLLNYAFKF